MLPTRSSWFAPLFALACSSALPGPREGAQPGEAAIAESVEYPPPPAQAEVVPPRPDREECVWLDGHWDWVGSRWTWVAGEWLVAPAGCYYAPAVLSWPNPGQLMFLRPHWYPNDAEKLPPERARSACKAPVSCSPAAETYQSKGGLP